MPVNCLAGMGAIEHMSFFKPCCFVDVVISKIAVVHHTWWLELGTNDSRISSWRWDDGFLLSISTTRLWEYKHLSWACPERYLQILLKKNGWMRKVAVADYGWMSGSNKSGCCFSACSGSFDSIFIKFAPKKWAWISKASTGVFKNSDNSTEQREWWNILPLQVNKTFWELLV